MSDKPQKSEDATEKPSVTFPEKSKKSYRSRTTLSPRPIHGSALPLFSGGSKKECFAKASMWRQLSLA
jgi:hypothetical protein